MTPQEFADAHGLSLEEAQLILAKRSQQSPDPNSRLALAKAKLEAAHKKTGAAPVAVSEDGLVKGDVSMENLERFYSTKGFPPPFSRPFRVAEVVAPEDQSQDPEDWEEPP